MTILSDLVKNKDNPDFYKNLPNIPIWLLRQAGRYMSEYQEIRQHINTFLDLCYDSEKASMVTMQPIEKFDMDAAIIFSDILVLPDAIGWDVEFKKNEGPILKKFTKENSHELGYKNFESKLASSRANHVYETVSKVRSKLSKNKSLIGFAGSPWTVASYMIEGKGKHDFSYCKSFIYENRDLSLWLIDILVMETIEYLSGQIEAGVDIIMLFDSWSGVLNGKEYDDFVINPTKKIIDSIKSRHSNIPVIGFPRGSGYNYDRYIKNTGIDVVSVDQFTPLEQIRKWQDSVVVQGNFDPAVLLTNSDIIRDKVDEIFNILDKKNFIFNIGHGILQTTNPDNVEFLVEYVKSK